MPGPYVDTKSSLVLYKTFPYRGGTQTFSNRYHTNGPLTIGLTAFNTLADAVAADEAPIYAGEVTIVRADWCDATSATSTNPHGLVTHTKPLSNVGSMSSSGGTPCPGDCAMLARYTTDARTAVTNHPIYLFNYYHAVYRASGGTADALLGTQLTNLQEYADDWLAGFSDGTNTHIRCSPRGAVAQNRYVHPEIRHRDFPT